MDEDVDQGRRADDDGRADDDLPEAAPPFGVAEHDGQASEDDADGDDIRGEGVELVNDLLGGRLQGVLLGLSGEGGHAEGIDGGEGTTIGSDHGIPFFAPPEWRGSRRFFFWFWV